MKENGFIEKLVAINRITKVVKRWKTIWFCSACCCWRSKRIYWYWKKGKSKQVPDAIKKATEMAKKNMIKIPLKDGRTLHHDIYSKNGSGKVLMRSAPTGTGIIAGGAVRAVCEVLGIQDVVAKSFGSANPHNVLKALISGGLKIKVHQNIYLHVRGKTISEIIKKRENKMKLNNLIKTNFSKIRVGRGIGSGKGKTSGRGVKKDKNLDQVLL